jgi:hypothetical protein
MSTILQNQGDIKMRKILFIACAMAVVGVVAFATLQRTPADAAANVVVERALRVDADFTRPIPEGYRRVPIHVKSDAKAKSLWLQATGTLEGYTLEKAAQQLSFVARVGTAPCACWLEGACAKYDPSTRTCEEGCNCPP